MCVTDRAFDPRDEQPHRFGKQQFAHTLTDFRRPIYIFIQQMDEDAATGPTGIAGITGGGGGSSSSRTREALGSDGARRSAGGSNASGSRGGSGLGGMRGPWSGHGPAPPPPRPFRAAGAAQRVWLLRQRLDVLQVSE